MGSIRSMILDKRHYSVSRSTIPIFLLDMRRLCSCKVVFQNLWAIFPNPPNTDCRRGYSGRRTASRLVLVGGQFVILAETKETLDDKRSRARSSVSSGFQYPNILQLHALVALSDDKDRKISPQPFANGSTSSCHPRVAE